MVVAHGHRNASAALALFLLLAALVVACRAEPMKTEPLVVATADRRSVSFTVELAVTPEQREHGLMGRTILAEGEGMLFDFGTPRRVFMWMRNTLIPLDMLFIDAGGRIVHIRENAQPMSETIIDSRQDVRFVLEIAGGASRRQKIAIGDRVSGRPISAPGAQ